jgi:hypothetical protein
VCRRRKSIEYPRLAWPDQPQGFSRPGRDERGDRTWREPVHGRRGAALGQAPPSTRGYDPLVNKGDLKLPAAFNYQAVSRQGVPMSDGQPTVRPSPRGSASSTVARASSAMAPPTSPPTPKVSTGRRTPSSHARGEPSPRGCRRQTARLQCRSELRGKRAHHAGAVRRRPSTSMAAAQRP